MRRREESTGFGGSPEVLGRDELPHRALDAALASSLIEFPRRPRQRTIRDKDAGRGGRYRT
jgi:hypothetical protein